MSWVGDDQKSWLSEFLGVLVGEGTWSPSAGGGGEGTSELSIFDDSSLTIGSGRDADNILRVLNSDNDSGGELDLLPGLFNINQMNTIVFSSDVRLHGMDAVLGSNMALGGQQS